MYALNFYSELYEDILRKDRKTVTIRLGDKEDKYRTGMLVWITVGPRYGRRQKLYSAILDKVEVKPISDLTPREIEKENPEFRSQDDVIAFLSRIYSDFLTPAHLVTVIHFSRVDESPF
ncbi:MAG: ASCH domain-containing protein [Armatimonadetes bacterium]|nr:ASCH domain-containing protein [Armatimonadota bacterium]